MTRPDIGPRSVVVGVARGLLGGVLGATAMSATTAAQARLLPHDQEPVDYDASRHVSDAVGTVLGRRPRTQNERDVYFALAHWGYGSAVALTYAPLRSAVRSDLVAAGLFLVGCEAMALTLLPTLGGTPPPGRWSARLLLTSVAQHAVYAAVVAGVHRALAAPHAAPGGCDATVAAATWPGSRPTPG